VEDSVKAFYDTIILSPHLDDAALSCGGQISLQVADGQSVLVVTLMAGDPPAVDVSPFAQSLHDRWEFQTEAVARRREEDRTACQILRADCLHWALPDCIYRHDPLTGEPYYNSNQDIFGRVHSDEKVLQDILVEKLAKLPEHGRVLAPLSVGNHVDHQVTRSAAESCFGVELIYYEDYPYAAVPGAVETITATDGELWHSQTIPISEAAMEKKINAIAAYASQMSTFFLDRADLEQQVQNYSKFIGGERIWWPRRNG
jgi:LmbE family N-acetylglucosaminyl deacetylase